MPNTVACTKSMNQRISLGKKVLMMVTTTMIQAWDNEKNVSPQVG